MVFAMWRLCTPPNTCFLGPTQSPNPKRHLDRFSRFGRPFVKRLALCYQIVVCPVLSVTLVYCDQTVGWIKMKLGAGSARPWPQCVGWRPSSRSPKGVQPPNFRPIYVVAKCMAGWIKMPLGTKVGFDPSNIVLDGDPAPLPQKRDQSPPIFGPCLLWPNGWMDQYATWHGGRPLPRPHCDRADPAPPSRGTATSPNFRPMSIVAKRLHRSTCRLVQR